jgi:hypothetical protein
MRVNAMRADIPYIERKRGTKRGARTEEAQSKYGTRLCMPLTCCVANRSMDT